MQRFDDKIIIIISRIVEINSLLSKGQLFKSFEFQNVYGQNRYVGIYEINGFNIIESIELCRKFR
jgi:hypothetical protein